MNPLRDCHLWTHQTSRGHTKVFAWAWYNSQTMCPTWPSEELCAMFGRECETLYCSFIRAPVGTDSDRATTSLHFRLGQKNRSDGRKLSIPLTSCTLAARRGAPSTNLLADLDTPLSCASSRQTPSPRNLWRTRQIGPGLESLPGLSTRSCPTCRRSQHLWVIVLLKLLG